MLAALPRVRRPLVWATAALLTPALALAWPQEVYAAISFVFLSIVDVAPAVGFGLFLSAWVGASGAAALTANWFKGRPATAIVMASIVGALTPDCGITVLPLMMGLLASGVPLAPVMAFWLSSPITDPAMIAVTWAVLGPAFAIGKAGAAFALGIFSGIGTALLAGTRMVDNPLRAGARLAAAQCSPDIPAGFAFAIWRHPARWRAFRDSFWSMARLVALCLGLAFAAEFLLRATLPPQLLADFVGSDSPYAIPLAVLVGSPIYVDGYAALPLVRGLLDLGMSPGAAMAFLVSGGSVSIWGMLAVLPVLRPQTIALFAAFALTGSMAIGYAFSAIWAWLP